MSALRAIGIAGSVTTPSRSGALVEEVLSRLATHGVETEMIDLTTLSADGLLWRAKDAGVTSALERVTGVPMLVIGTPVYRASYTGQLKAFFDLLPRDALAGSSVGCIATGAGQTHALVIDHGLRPLVASLAGLTAAHTIYATDVDLGGYPKDPLPEMFDEPLTALVEELVRLASRT